MLGIGGLNKKWQWGICGKHPVVKDYFKIGNFMPALDALENWMQKGYGEVSKRSGHDAGICSWRFWARGIKKKELIAGIVKDSYDTIGRPFPLLVLGNGVLEEWERNWECLPVFFEKLWESLEYLTTRRLNGLHDLENAIISIKSPENNPERFGEIKDTLNRISPEPADESNAQQTPGALLKEQMAIISMDEKGGPAYSFRAGKWSSLSKTYAEEAPKTVFIGGTEKKHYLALFRRPINTEDFIRLWSP
ncbi:MAG: DUF2094 domain-containing protein [Desulfobacteraceae bacterium]|jgi:type VI secretion system protein VasJ|nr:MAG: DUF2094 domain-containing protein [Desulfobacteraceae bacterium]